MMRLKTEMFDAGNGRRFPNYQDGEDVDHDAAAAHALMQAIAEYESDYLVWRPCNILNRADEIMREWGFDSEEME